MYFDYEKLNGSPVKAAFIGCGDEANVLMTEHPMDYMELVAIADPRKANIDDTFKGTHPEARIGLIKKLGQEKAAKVQVFAAISNCCRLGPTARLILRWWSSPCHSVSTLRLRMACLEAGLHVLTEKLMAHNITECKQMIRKAEEKGLLLGRRSSASLQRAL
jgi:hypothetical protein